MEESFPLPPGIDFRAFGSTGGIGLLPNDGDQVSQVSYGPPALPSRGHFPRMQSGATRSNVPRPPPLGVTQAAEALRFCHAHATSPTQMFCYNNLFVNGRLNAKLGDFAGSSIDGGSLAQACYASFLTNCPPILLLLLLRDKNGQRQTA
ncbi:MAG: hypothetical protein M1837_007199 [Sclerophora amabilis]|nr:MAG: hypothetical protein M1837_007199 [Sclerophora amabilis]